MKHTDKERTRMSLAATEKKGNRDVNDSVDYAAGSFRECTKSSCAFLDSFYFEEFYLLKRLNFKKYLPICTNQVSKWRGLSCRQNYACVLFFQNLFPENCFLGLGRGAQAKKNLEFSQKNNNKLNGKFWNRSFVPNCISNVYLSPQKKFRNSWDSVS